MKRFSLIYILLLMILAGCTWSKNQPEKTADELAADGHAYFTDEKFEKAIKSYKKLKDWYPFSTHVKEAELKIADAYFFMESYDEGILAYTEYERLHPNDEKIPYIIFQIAMCDFKRIESIDRDATATRSALKAFQRLIEQFPGSGYAKTAAAHIDTCLSNLAEKEMEIGLFYFKSRKYAAAMKRFMGVVTEYPDYGLHQQAMDAIETCKATIARKEQNEAADAGAKATEKPETLDYGPESR